MLVLANVLGLTSQFCISLFYFFNLEINTLSFGFLLSYLFMMIFKNTLSSTSMSLAAVIPPEYCLSFSSNGNLIWFLFAFLTSIFWHHRLMSITNCISHLCPHPYKALHLDLSSQMYFVFSLFCRWKIVFVLEVLKPHSNTDNSRFPLSKCDESISKCDEFRLFLMLNIVLLWPP